MRKIIVLSLIFSFIFAFARAENSEITLSLDEAVAFALRDNRDILLGAGELKKAKAKLYEAESGLLPTLNFTGGWTDTNGLSQKDLALTTTQTTVKQTLFKGGKIINTIKYNQYGLEVAKAVLDKTKLEVVLNVKKAFFTLSLARDFSLLNEEILKNAQEHLETAKKRVKSGQASESDILKMQESVAGVREAYEASLNQAEASQSLLRNLLSLDKQVEIIPQGKFDFTPQEFAYDRAILEAFSGRPEIRQFEAKINAAKKAVEIAKADGRPTIFASWEYFSRSSGSAIASSGTVTGTTGSASRGWNDYNTTGLTFSWPVFDGFATKAKVNQAVVDLKNTQLLKEKTISDIALELKNSYLSLKDALSKIESMESEIKVYNDNLATVKAKYQQGIASLLELDDASLKYGISLFNKKQALYDYCVAKAGFDKATGGM